MTKQFETKAAQVSGRNPGISRVISDCIGTAYNAGKHGVIRPATIETPMVEDAVRGNEGLSAQLNAIHWLSFFSQVEEEIPVMLWLASPGPSLVTGHAHPIDAGRLI